MCLSTFLTPPVTRLKHRAYTKVIYAFTFIAVGVRHDWTVLLERTGLFCHVLLHCPVLSKVVWLTLYAAQGNLCRNTWSFSCALYGEIEQNQSEVATIATVVTVVAVRR